MPRQDCAAMVTGEAATKIWAAGVQASPLGGLVAEAAGTEVDRAGRVRVGPDCTLPGHPEVFVVGDLMALDRRDMGTMATISRFSAIASVGRIRSSGFIAWLLWLFVHLVALTGFKNRVAVLANWTIAFLGRGRPQRTITAQQVFARQALESQTAAITTDSSLRSPAELTTTTSTHRSQESLS